MKANTPENIYISTNSQDGTYYISNQYKRLIEYTRTDAFIEKAKKWFEKQNEWRDLNGIKHCDMENFENFKNYMKGE